MHLVFLSLGNPGDHARHSVGHYVLEHMVEAFDAPPLTSCRGYEVLTFEEITFLKSRTFMNESAKALKAAVADHRVARDATVVVVHDDFELPLGKVKLLEHRPSESHHGVRLLLPQLARHRLLKLAIGIGPKPTGSSATIGDWVLQPFSSEQLERVDAALPMVFAYVRELLEGADPATINATVRAEFA